MLNSPSVHDPQTRQTIVRLLSSMGSAKEISQYLKRFSQMDAARFAVVKVGGAVLRDDLDALVSSLAFLQDVGLTPIVIHGAGPQLDAELAAAGIEKQIINGLRVTSPQALAIVRRVFHAQNLKLVEALQASDTRATSIVSGVFEADYLDRERYGLVGEVKQVDLAPIQTSLQAGSIPVIASLGETMGGQILNVNADFAANDLLHRRYVEARWWIDGGMRIKIAQIKDLLDGLPLASSVSITKPAELAKELFTHKGSGTLVRRGERVLQASRWDQLDLPRLRELIESAFGRTLLPDYFERTPLHGAYVSENYRAAVILTSEDAGVYLDKFAVLDDAQGEGLGRAVWQVMRDQNPRLFWRSRRGNPVNPFYYAESDGCIKQAQWKVFWYGLVGFDEISQCVEHCHARPATLRDEPDKGEIR